MNFFKSKKTILALGCVLLAGISFVVLKFGGHNTKRGDFGASNSIGSSKENKVPIAMALDDGYTYPTIVAMTSMLENRHEGTEYDYYIMHPSNLNEENKNKLKSLEKKHKNCKVTLIDMAEKYKSANESGHITTPAYYRLSLSELLPSLDKMIWLDGDTITYTDLKEMYDIDMEGYYYKGFLDDNVSAVDDFGVNNDHVICSGVMLLNLKELRKDDMVNKFSKFIEENNERLIQHDQTTINVVAYKKVGILPAKWGIYNYVSLEAAKEQAKIYRFKNGYSEKELEQAYLNPSVLHCNSKPWKDITLYGAADWWEYAKKTDFYDEIKAKYPIL